MLILRRGYNWNNVGLYFGGLVSGFIHGFQLSVESNLRLLWVCFIMLCDWSEKISRRLLSESEVKLKPIVTCLHAFSRA